MMDHINALKTAMDTGVYAGKVWIMRVTEATPRLPYILIEPVHSAPGYEDSLVFDDGNQDILVRIKGVGTAIQSGHHALNHAKTHLTGGRRLGKLPLVGRDVTLQYLRHEADYEDTLTLTDSSVVTISVDTYQLISQPK